MLPRVAITMGDPGGIGPEVIWKALARPDVLARMRPVVIGDAAVMQAAAQALPSTARVQEVQDLEQEVGPDTITVFAPPGLPTSRSYTLGEVGAENGHAAHACIVHAAALALAGKMDAICTAPISKEAMFAAGYNFPGHTELLAHLCGDVPVRMMLVGGGLRVALQTIHVALSEVPGLLSGPAILESLQIMQAWGERTLGTAPRIAVCGLNPHAGEGGHFGREELDVIAPAITEAAAAGIQASGPYPADTVFHRMREREFDLVLAMYHDQALIPVKTLDFHGGVNVTLGLPIVRTSPDHGTAFPIAGKGIAREDSMVAALLAATP